MTAQEEVWKQIQGFEQYEISNYGQVRHIYHKKLIILKQKTGTAGYSEITLCLKGKKYTKMPHRLVLENFEPLSDGLKMEGNHKNGIKSDNRLSNLEWCTKSENIKHAFDTGLKHISPPKGTKVNESIVRDIRTNRMTITEYSKLYGISTTSVHEIKNRKYWKKVL